MSNIVILIGKKIKIIQLEVYFFIIPIFGTPLTYPAKHQCIFPSHNTDIEVILVT